MAEMLGILLALVIVGFVSGVARLVRVLRRWCALPVLARLEQLRGRRLRSSRATVQAQATRIAELTAELERTRARLRQAERARDAALAAARWEERFHRAKRAFALRFHPDRLRGTSRAERSLRVAMFHEYWTDLQRIERG